MVGQNISLKLSTIGKYSFKTVHTKRAINWSLPNKRYACVILPITVL